MPVTTVFQLTTVILGCLPLQPLLILHVIPRMKKKVNYFISYDCMKSKDKVETPTSIKLYSLRAQSNFTPPDVFCHCLLYLFIIISVCKVGYVAF